MDPTSIRSKAHEGANSHGAAIVADCQRRSARDICLDLRHIQRNAHSELFGGLVVYWRVVSIDSGGRGYGDGDRNMGSYLPCPSNAVSLGAGLAASRLTLRCSEHDRNRMFHVASRRRAAIAHYGPRLDRKWLPEKACAIKVRCSWRLSRSFCPGCWQPG